MCNVDEVFIIILLLVVAILLSSIFCIWILIYCQTRRHCNLGAESVVNFKKGNPRGINPNLPLNEQSYLLPYNVRFEFPKKKLELGEKFMFGTFGHVLKGTARGILTYEEKTTVTVKKIESTTDDEMARALVSELKILVNTGKHLNLVNLLGAITNNIKRRKITVILEYCPFGNIKDILKKNRARFINQISNNGTIDPTITGQSPRTSNNNSSNRRSTPLQTNNSPGIGVRPITTTDLLCWSFQTTRAMQHLASHKILHANLCAENIMLCEDNVVKICNFGLSQSMYTLGIGRDRSNEQFKWMALETLKDQVYSIYSDVWSFGIVLWEFFTLGETPYSDWEKGDDLYYKLNKGIRMSWPKYATEDIYHIMLSCWDFLPKSRPLFDKLETIISKLLTHDVTEDCIAKTEFFLRANAINFDPDQPDYLAGITALENMDSTIPSYIDYNRHGIEMTGIEMTGIEMTETHYSHRPDIISNPIYDAIR